MSRFLKHLSRFTIAALLVAALALPAIAQQAGSPVRIQQDPTRLDAAGGVAVGTNWNTVNTQSVATTATPQAGLSVYVTALYMAACQNGTGSASTNTNFTETGLSSTSAANVAGYSAAATANSCVGSPGFVVFPVPQKAVQPGIPVVLTSPSAVTNTGFASEIFYYIAQ